MLIATGQFSKLFLGVKVMLAMDPVDPLTTIETFYSHYHSLQRHCSDLNPLTNWLSGIVLTYLVSASASRILKRLL